jgi:hypothetical protein
MARSILGIVLLLTLLVQDISTSSAQSIGEIGTIIDLEGNLQTELTVFEIESDVDADVVGTEPESGTHFAGVAVDIRNRSVDTVAIDFKGFRVTDSNGMLYEPIGADPPIAAGEVQSGDILQGSVYFQLPNGIDIHQVVFHPEDQPLVFLVDESSPAAVGQTTPVLGTKPEQTADITIHAVADPDLNAGMQIEPGLHVMAIEVSVTNTGDSKFRLRPTSIIPVDEQGYLGAPAFPDNETSPFMSPIPVGESISATLSFVVRDGIPLTRIMYQTNLQLIALASGPFASEAIAVASPVAGDCTGVKEWASSYFELLGDYEDTTQYLEQFVNGELSIGDIDANEMEQAADELLELSGKVADLETPEAAASFHALLVEDLETAAGAAYEIAAAAHAGDSVTSQRKLEEMAGAFADPRVAAAYEALAAACPDVAEVVQ